MAAPLHPTPPPTPPTLFFLSRPVDRYHIDKTPLKVPVLCGARNLGEALRRINEGASMIRTKGAAGTGDVIQAVKHVRTVKEEVSLCRWLE